MTFHEQQECVYDFPSLSLATRTSADVSELVFKQEWRSEILYLRTYSRVQKSIENFVFRPKMAIFRRAGMREGGLPLPLAFQYLILMI